MNDPLLAADTADASAASLFINLPEILKLPTESQQFERILAYFETVIQSYLDGLDGWTVPEPSKN